MDKTYQVRMRTTDAGPDGSFNAGSVRVVGLEQGKELVTGKYADWDPPLLEQMSGSETAAAPNETATRKPAETATRRGRHAPVPAPSDADTSGSQA